MRKASVLLAAVAGVVIAAGCAASTSTGSVAQAATVASCSRNIGTSANNDYVIIHIVQSCGRSYRSVGMWGGGSYDGYHYGTYHNTNGLYSTACADSNCNAGNVLWGGYERKTDGKEWCFYLCSNAPAGVIRTTVFVTTTELVRKSTCGDPIQWTYSGIPNFIWATRWHPNTSGCQQQSKVQCATHGITKIFYGGWVTPTDKWSGVNCTNSYPTFIQGGYRVRAFSGAPIVRDKWVFHQDRVAKFSNGTLTTLAAALHKAGLHLCETSSPNLCIGAVTINHGDPVTEQTGGRVIFAASSGNNTLLEFNTSPARCLGFDLNDIQGRALNCSGETGILWTGTLVNGHWHFKNNHWSQVDGESRYLAGQGCLNCQFQTQPTGLGYREAFDFS